MVQPIPCASRRNSIFVAGVFNLVLGIVSILCIFLLAPVAKRDVLMGKKDIPSTMNHEQKMFSIWTELTILLCFYIPPVLLLLINGFLMVICSCKESQLMIKFCSCLTYVLIVGCYAIVFSMLFVGVELIPIIPLVLIAIFQTYVVWVIQDYHLNWLDLPKPCRILDAMTIVSSISDKQFAY